jgi:hypothetical protein
MGAEKRCSLVFIQPTRSSEADDADDNAIISLSGCGHIGDQPVALGVLLNLAGMRTLQQAGHAPALGPRERPARYRALLLL